VQSVSDPDKLVLLELWKDQAALDAHAKLQAQRPPLPGCGSAPASARTIPTPAPAERGRCQNAGLVFRNRPLLRALEPAAGMADAGRRLRPRGRLARLSWHDRAQPVRRGTGVRLGQRLRAPLFAAHPDPVP